jgi:hypothetical protein
MLNAEDFRNELTAQLARADKRGATHVQINARELHRTLGGYPGWEHRMTCCDVMQQEMTEGDQIVFAPDR